MNTRYALPLLVLSLFGLIPVVRHHYLGARAEDGLSAEQAPARAAGASLVPLFDRPAWISEVFATGDWTMRRFVDSTGREFLLHVVRSYDAKRLYHHPELALIHGRDLRAAGTSRLAAAQDIPIHVLRGERQALVAYTLVYDGVAVDDPYRLQLAIAGRLLVGPRRKMTLVFGQDLSAPIESDLEQNTMVGAVLAATRVFMTPASSADTARR